MKLYFLTSTDQKAFEAATKIAISRDGAICKVVRYKTTEVAAILEFAKEACERIDSNNEVVFSSRRNHLRDAFEQRWINSWIVDGFKNRPPKHRSEWSQFYQSSLARNIHIRFEDLPLETEHMLERALGKRKGPLRHAPGDPVEYPWTRPETADELVQRALKRSE